MAVQPVPPVLPQLQPHLIHKHLTNSMQNPNDVMSLFYNHHLHDEAANLLEMEVTRREILVGFNPIRRCP